ncbi:MAG: hypothetical protein K2J68_00290 [Treponemataceae bacterium]|nr:hypothetical protein [Treponemataceae bacterium]
MKKILFCATFMASAFCLAFPQKILTAQEPLVQFLKGDISEKTAAVKRAGENSSLAMIALEFVVENSEILKDDRDLAGLAVAATLSLPEAEYERAQKETIDILKGVFFAFDDDNVRVSVFDKMAAFYVRKNFEPCVEFINEFLSNATSSGTAAGESERKAVETLGRIGNGSSFTPLYSVLRLGIWPEVRTLAENSLAKIADKSLNEILEEIEGADLDSLKTLFKIYQINEISPSLRSEFAENTLERSMIIMGNSQNSRDLASFQLECAKVLAENQWTRAAELGEKYFGAAKSAYERGFLDESQFASAIKCVESISSRKSVKFFTDYMTQMNRAQEEKNFPSKTVALAIIDALGSLGDKSAFDCLLYVTYLDYPEEVTSAARNALTRLKW